MESPSQGLCTLSARTGCTSGGGGDDDALSSLRLDDVALSTSLVYEVVEIITRYNPVTVHSRLNNGQGCATQQGRQSPTSQSSEVKLEMEDKMVQKNKIKIK